MAQQEKKVMPKRKSVREVAKSDTPRVLNVQKRHLNVLEILANKHPYSIEEYAVHLYRHFSKSILFTVFDYRVYDDMETVDLIVDTKIAKVNTRTGTITTKEIVNTVPQNP